MRQATVILALAAGTISPMVVAQSTQGTESRTTSADAGASPGDATPASKARRAMASFDSLLREAVAQSQAKQRAAASTKAAEPAQPARDREDLAETPVADAVH
jgi:type IV secretory pathway TrbF-like protein